MINFKILIFLGLQIELMHGQLFLEKPSYAIPRLPDTNFNCKNKVLGNYYADPETQCQMFHVCVQVLGVGVQDFRFLCPNGTAFDQEAQICTDWGDVDCHQASFSNGLNFDIFRIKVQKHMVKLNKEIEIKEEDPLRLQNLSQDNNDEVFRGSHSSNFFANRNRGLENFNDYKDVSSNHKSLTTAKSTVNADRKQSQQIKFHQMTQNKNEYRLFSENKNIDSSKIKMTTTTFNSIFNLKEKNHTEYFTTTTVRTDLNSKKSNSIIKSNVFNYDEKQFNSNNHSKSLNYISHYQSTLPTYHNKTKNDYQYDSHTQKAIRQPNRISSSQKIQKNYAQNTTKKPFSFYDNNEKSISKDFNLKSTSKNPYFISSQTYTYDKEKLVTELPKTFRLKARINVNTNPTSTSTKLDALYFIPSNEVKTHKKLSTEFLNNSDIPTTFRPLIKKNLYNNLNNAQKKRIDENVFLNQNSVPSESKSYIEPVLLHSSSSLLENSNNNEEEIFKTSNSYNIGAYRINHFPVQSTQKYITAAPTPNIIVSEKNAGNMRNRGSIKSYEDILPEFIYKKKIDLDKTLSKPNNSYKNSKKQDVQNENLKIQTARPNKQTTQSLNNNNNNPLISNQYQNNDSITLPNVNLYNTEKAIEPKFSTKHQENFSEKSRYLNFPDNQAIKSSTQKSVITEKKQENKKLLKKKSDNEDTSYDYAYYDELKDYGGLDIFSDFEKIRKA